MENIPIPPLENLENLRNPRTKETHKKESRLQIIVPICLLILAIILGIMWIVNNKIGTPKMWAEIVVVLTTVPTLIISLAFLLLIIGLIYLITLANKEIPPFTYKTQLAIFKIKKQVEQGADISAKPVIQVQSYLATIDAFLALFRGKNE